jgi:hypothetical protein
MEEKPEVIKQESIEVVKINIQILFNDKSVKDCEVPHEVLVKIADILYEYECQRDKTYKDDRFEKH